MQTLCSALHYNAETERQLKGAVNKVYQRYITEKIIYSLLLTDGQALRDHLNKVGTMYQMVQSSIRFAQYRRAAWYIGAMHKYCMNHFGEVSCLRVLKTIDNRFS